MTYGDGLTEECPLTKDQNKRWKDCCGGLHFIIGCFTLLSFAITVVLILQILFTENLSQERSSLHGAVATDYINCSQIGTKILRKGGNAIDAAVGATVCMTVVAPYKTGLGGGGYMMIYNHKDQMNPIVIDFANNTAEGMFGTMNLRIPGLLRGLEHAQSLYGHLLWSELIEPSIKMAREGFVVSREFAHEVSKNVIYGTQYGQLSVGQILKLPILADSLELIARQGANALYNGTLSKKFFQDEIIQEELLNQLATYQPVTGVANYSPFNHHIVYYSPHLTSLMPILTTLNESNITKENASSIESQFFLAKTLINFNPNSKTEKNFKETRYTGIMAMDWNDKYVSVVTGISAPSESLHMTGAGFWQDRINDNNILSLVPIIIRDAESICGLRAVFGTDNVIVASQILYNLVIRGLTLSDAIENPRYYLLADGIAVESDERYSLDTKLRDQLKLIIPVFPTDTNFMLKSINAIVKNKDSMVSHSDTRGGEMSLASRF